MNLWCDRGLWNRGKQVCFVIDIHYQNTSRDFVELTAAAIFYSAPTSTLHELCGLLVKKRFSHGVIGACATEEKTSLFYS